MSDLESQLEERSERIRNLERQLELVCENYAAKIATVTNTTIRDGEATRNSVQSSIMELRSLLDEGFKAEKQVTEKMLRQNEDTTSALMVELQAAKDQLAYLAENQRHNSTEIRTSQKGLDRDQEVVANLKLRISELEHESKTSMELRQRWIRDIRMMDPLRTKLKALQERLPLMEGLGMKLDEIVQMNASAQSASSYLATEKDWIRQQLEAKTDSQNNEGTALVSYSNGETLFASNPEASNLPGHMAEDSNTESYTSSLEEEVASRKVVVHSPIHREDSPVPPSVQQEQKRRRELIQLRSILKHHVPSKRESTNLESDSLQLSIRTNQYHHHSEGDSNDNKTVVTNAVVAEIRSSLIQQREWSPPTVADFETSNHFSMEGQSGRDKQSLLYGRTIGT
ncbi:hypothetical protein PT974_03532 [Cladobotryum mycophilum]|uniref:Uncharacterized protein n=1 Tax=Cladobotryum mycophilum TaxID=491253 RepID=A0ABR0SSJ1_9HYPO